MTVWTTTSKNVATFTNQSKNTTAFTMQDKTLVFSHILREEGSVLLREDGGMLRRESGATSVSWTNQNKS